jgi:hypothetical protein
VGIDQAVRYSEILLAFAYILQSLEFMRGHAPERYLGFARLLLSVLLLFNIAPVAVESCLLIIAVWLLYRFQGPYNGGSDAMSILLLICLWLSHLAPNQFWREIALGYLAFQVIFSYFQAGYIKIINPAWRSGDALREVFAFTAYPVSESVRAWATSPRLLRAMGWAVMVFELVFPLTLLHQGALVIALFVAAVFHLANACLFGLNRFFWIWPASYPVLIWFQDRLF